MNDYISRDEAIFAAKRADDRGVSLEDAKKMSAAVVAEIENLPAADVKPAVHSYWEKDPDGGCVCHKCRERPLLDGSEEPVLSDFCPSCGAEMKED
jgi:hypothetical protein